MISELSYIAIAAFFVLGIGGIANLRARRESAHNDAELSKPTRALMFLAFSGFFITLAIAAITHALSIDLPEPLSTLAFALGLSLIAAGALLAGAIYIRSIPTWDVDTPHLETHGPHALSRNPRAVAWTGVILGIGLATHSGVVVALAPIFLLGYLPWIMLEEIVLERHFGDQYRNYRARTRRFL